MIWDGVLYNGEVDMLECRLTELADVVDMFVIVEGDKSFTGGSRVRGSRERFSAWAEKIRWVDFETPLDVNPWKVEAATRNELFAEFERLGVQDADIVTVCDVDEIWSPSMVESFAQGWCAMLMRHLVFSVHWEAELELTGVAGPWGLRSATADLMRRQKRYEMMRVVGGWHLGWMGGPEWCVGKVRQFSHQELNNDQLDAKIVRCFSDGVFFNGSRLEEREIDGDWPLWIRLDRHPKSWRWRR